MFLLNHSLVFQQWLLLHSLKHLQENTCVKSSNTEQSFALLLGMVGCCVCTAHPLNAYPLQIQTGLSVLCCAGSLCVLWSGKSICHYKAFIKPCLVRCCLSAAVSLASLSVQLIISGSELVMSCWINHPVTIKFLETGWSLT